MSDERIEAGHLPVDAERARSIYVDEYTRRVRAEAENEKLRASLQAMVDAYDEIPGLAATELLYQLSRTGVRNYQHGGGPLVSDERIEAPMTREEMIAHAAWHIDKYCTGGTDEDWVAAEQIIKDLVDPLLDRLRDARSEDEVLYRRKVYEHEDGTRSIGYAPVAARSPQGEDHEAAS